MALLIFVIAFLKNSNAQAGELCRDGTITLQAEKYSFQIGNCSGYLFDPESRWRVEQIISGAAGSFRGLISVAPNLGFKSGTFWLRFDLRNEGSAETKMFMSLGNPLIDSARFFRIGDDGKAIELGAGGVLVPGFSKAVIDRDVTFTTTIAAQTKATFLVEARAIQQSYLPVIRDATSFQRHQLLEYLAFGLYFGVIVVMALYNFVLFFVVRDKSYLWYVGSITFFHGFCFVGLLGASNHFFWPDSPLWAQRQLSSSAPLGLLFTLLFADSFLKISAQSIHLARMMKFLLATVLVQLVVSALWFDVLVVKLGFVLQVSALGLVLSSALPNALRGDRSARLFLSAWAFLILGGLLFSFGQFGFFPHSFLTQNGILFGSAVEVVLLSFALGDKINIMRNEKDSAQQRALESANQRAQIESELLAANAVQETLLPPRNLTSSVDISTCYMVAERVGGDWYWHTHDPINKVLYFYIGDVTGHGVPSALLTGVVCGAVASLETEYASTGVRIEPCERLLHTAEVINDVVRKTGARSDRWVSMCLIALEEETGKLTIVNAGHPFPMVWRKNRGVLESMVSSGPLMGLSGGTFSHIEEYLDSGDSVMLYTDGYNEAREKLKLGAPTSRRRDLISLFQKSGSPETFVETVRADLAKLMAGGNTLSDDVTLVLFRWSKRETAFGQAEEEKAA
ncbi:MAG: 7TM diverse intracellular signaling domain-containing protein [Silvanigrellaceae bacterium]